MRTRAPTAAAEATPEHVDVVPHATQSLQRNFTVTVTAQNQTQQIGEDTRTHSGEAGGN